MPKLYELLKGGFGSASHYSDDEKREYGAFNMNCCERILRGANIVYKLGLSEDALRAAAPFGGGMGIGSVCGAVTGSLMVLGIRYSGGLEKSSPLKAEITVPFMKAVRMRQGGLSCAYNKKRYALQNPFDCSPVILAIAAALDETIEALDAGRGEHE